MDTSIRMSQKEISRYHIIQKTIRKELTNTQASNILHLSQRQVGRIKKRVKTQGIRGLIHRNRGKPSNRKISEQEENEIKSILKKKYPDFAPTFATEKLREKHSIKHDRKTIQRIMIEEGLLKPKRKQASEKHRHWRQRRSSRGELVQYDGCYHDWFEGRSKEGRKQCLLIAIDDAMSTIAHARFEEHEGVFPTFRFWQEYLGKNGKPMSIYVDKFSTYSVNHKIARQNPDTQTQFKRAMESLDIEIILANSPQAKGRVERPFRTLQDRLVKELRLNGINTVSEANIFLQNVFIPDYNRRFSVIARSRANLHRKITKKEKESFLSVFTRHHARVVRNDYTVSYRNTWYQLEATSATVIRKQDSITIEEREDGSIRMRGKSKYLDFHQLPDRPKKASQEKSPWILAKPLLTTPAKNHPWRRFQINPEKRKIQIGLKS